MAGRPCQGRHIGDLAHSGDLAHPGTRAPSPQAAGGGQGLSEAGVPTIVAIAPVIPGSPTTRSAYVEVAAEAGAEGAFLPSGAPAL